MTKPLEATGASDRRMPRTQDAEPRDQSGGIVRLGLLGGLFRLTVQLGSAELQDI